MGPYARNVCQCCNSYRRARLDHVSLAERRLGHRKTGFFGFATLLFAAPFVHENLLAGFQSQFYFLMLFSFLLLWAAYKAQQASLRWVVAVALMSLLSFFSMASGALSTAAAAGLMLTRRIVGVEKSRIGVAIMVALAVGFMIAVACTPTIPAHATLKAKNPLEFMFAILAATCGGILYLLVLVFMIRQLTRRPAADDHSWFVFALCLWVLGQILAIAYGRSHGIFSSRYLDLFAIGFLLNFYCLIFLIQEDDLRAVARKWLYVWLLLFMTVLGAFVPKMLQKINDKKTLMLENSKNVSDYLMTGDSVFLQKKPDDEIPYPDAARLKSLLDSPVISRILTPDVNGGNINSGYSFYTKKSRKAIDVVGGFRVFYGFSLLMVAALSRKMPRSEEKI